jgi:hypothetical protein
MVQQYKQYNISTVYNRKMGKTKAQPVMNLLYNNQGACAFLKHHNVQYNTADDALLANARKVCVAHISGA